MISTYQPLLFLDRWDQLLVTVSFLFFHLHTIFSPMLCFLASRKNSCRRLLPPNNSRALPIPPPMQLGQRWWSSNLLAESADPSSSPVIAVADASGGAGLGAAIGAESANGGDGARRVATRRARVEVRRSWRGGARAVDDARENEVGNKYFCSTLENDGWRL